MCPEKQSQADDLSATIHRLVPHARAAGAVDPGLLLDIPYFKRVFPEKEMWPLLTRLAAADGTPYISRRACGRGETIMAKGQRDHTMFWILAGSTQVVTMISGQLKVIHEARKGECLGELGVLKDTERTANVVAGKEGADLLSLDWRVCEVHPELGRRLYHLLALHLADKLDCAYGKQLKIIANSIRVLHDKTSFLIEKNRMLERCLQRHGIDPGEEMAKDHEEALEHAIATIKESLSLLEAHEQKTFLDRLGVV